ncbi:type II secretion system protein [Photobacterium rosenbergii]|uniref:Type II secretion system protein n=1 Tax=Photobacterium rosenbergii TaxID=294936 RepID=A0A2T3NH53_9GAMM|nr:type II secretion system protein [Photobacterium rosenbergii]PSW14367.1 type II secretion system protein [Photobacterium rosenbergii]
MDNNKGFTLIELVVVIVILGILAVTAAPKFMDIQSDARKSVLQGAQGAIESASAITFAKAAIDGSEKGESAITLEDGSIINVFNGLPVASVDNLNKVWKTDLTGFDVTYNEIASNDLDWDDLPRRPGIPRFPRPGEPTEPENPTNNAVIYGSSTSKDDLLRSNCFLAVANSGDFQTQVIDSGC